MTEPKLIEADSLTPSVGSETMVDADLDIDLERVIWDPDYRRDVLDRLNRRKRTARVR